jgi:trans-2,3-dihydro-3-hydroxyanthranilate isomerase
MRSYRYLHLDVFTDTPFEGNQLAVFPEPAGLSTEEMRRITKEMSFSECTFIFPADTAGTGVRMGRPTRVHISIEPDEGRITRERVGARSVLVGEGRLTW